jgi:formyl-CoA transferase
MLVPVRQADGSTITLPGIVPKLSRTPGGHHRDAPALGEHTEEVLRALPPDPLS